MGSGCGTFIVMEDEEELRSSVREEAQATRTNHERAYMSELGHRLRSLREERGMTQHVLAQAAGIATDMVSRLENGHYSSPGLRTLLRIAEGMGISVSALLPDVPSLNQASPEANLRARLNTLLHRVDLDDLELIVDIAGTVLARRRH